MVEKYYWTIWNEDEDWSSSALHPIHSASSIENAIKAAKKERGYYDAIVVSRAGTPATILQRKNGVGTIVRESHGFAWYTMSGKRMGIDKDGKRITPKKK